MNGSHIVWLSIGLLIVLTAVSAVPGVINEVDRGYEIDAEADLLKVSIPSGQLRLARKGSEEINTRDEDTEKTAGETSSDEKSERSDEMSQDASIFDFSAKSLSGEDISLSKYKGKVLLIVNTASKCGFTPQYEGLQELFDKYHGKGLEILGFPCNQFGAQEPGSDSEIGSFCQKNYGVEFQMFEKVDVNGDHAHPLYKFLTKEAPGALKTESIKWNFTKFLVDRDGKVLKRYAPQVTPHDLEPEIEKAL